MTLLENTAKIYYNALLKKDSNYEGVFFVGVKTTGIFCRPTCPARKPKFENCEFFENAQDALIASYRPCKRCAPLSHPCEASTSYKIFLARLWRAWASPAMLNLVDFTAALPFNVAYIGLYQL